MPLVQPAIAFVARPSDPLQTQLDAPIDADVFAHCARLAAEVAGLRTATDFARVMHGLQPWGPGFLRPARDADGPMDAASPPGPSHGAVVPTLSEALGSEHPAVLRALDAVAAELEQRLGRAAAVTAVQCRLLAFWELLAVAQPLGRWIRYGIQGGEPLVSAAFLRACGTARVRRVGQPRFAFQPDELAAHALGFERMMAHRRFH